MASKLPFFKFEVSEWMFGRIQKQPLEIQGLFINLCAKYWHKLGDINYDDACLDFGKENISALYNAKIIGNDEDMLVIKFLDDQLSECALNSLKQSEKGIKSAKLKAIRKQQSTTVQPLLTGVQPNSTEEKRREEKREEYITIDSQKCFDVLPVLSFYEAALNARQKEHGARAWKDLVGSWFGQNIQVDFNDNKHVFNSFSRYLINGKPENKKDNLPTRPI